ncbi:hypothetical protein ACN47E_005837 [Coniothyrium glycines]
MYTTASIVLLLASTTLAIPNLINIFPKSYHAAPFPRRDAAISSSAYSSSDIPTVTMTVTIFGTITATPEATPTVASTPSTPATSALPTDTSTSTNTPSSSLPPAQKLAGVYICADVFWSGACTHHLTPLGSSDEACTQLDGTASAIGPDMGFRCIFYTNSYCRPLASDGADALALVYPGEGNLLRTDKGDWNDRVYSYQCFEEEV